jgi:hypothetical protein
MSREQGGARFDFHREARDDATPRPCDFRTRARMKLKTKHKAGTTTDLDRNLGHCKSVRNSSRQVLSYFLFFFKSRLKGRKGGGGWRREIRILSVHSFRSTSAFPHLGASAVKNHDDATKHSIRSEESSRSVW